MGKEQFNRILWLDLEATGSGDEADIIEIGAVITDLGFNTIDTFQKVYATFQDIDTLDEVVQKMHTVNGLWEEVFDAKMMFFEPEAEQEFLQWLGPDRKHILLAGSGVQHYDRRYIARDWPNVNKRLTYYALDIGVLRRFMRLSKLENTMPSDNKNHRALDDTLGCIKEAKIYRDAINNPETQERLNNS